MRQRSRHARNRTNARCAVALGLSVQRYDALQRERGISSVFLEGEGPAQNICMAQRLRVPM